MILLDFRRIHLLDYGCLQEMADDSSQAGVLLHIAREPKRVWVEFSISGALLDTDVDYILFDTGVALDAWKTHTRNVMGRHSRL